MGIRPRDYFITRSTGRTHGLGVQSRPNRSRVRPFGHIGIFTLKNTGIIFFCNNAY